jgi:transcription elongation factor GreA
MSEDVGNHITREALAELEAELHELETTGREEMADRLRTARAWGDLKENSEYHDAKNAQAHLETKIQLLRDRRLNAVVAEGGGGGDVVAMGSKVTVRDAESGREQVHEIVSANESDPAQGKLSIDSPLGRALSGAKVGDEVSFEAPRGTRRLMITELG